jgi:hypothetical protein
MGTYQYSYSGNSTTVTDAATPGNVIHPFPGLESMQSIGFGKT